MRLEGKVAIAELNCLMCKPFNKLFIKSEFCMNCINNYTMILANSKSKFAFYMWKGISGTERRESID